MISRTFKLCLNAGTGSAPFINVSQTDKDEVWLFELYTETGERYIPSSGAIIGIKADGHGIANTGTVDSEGRVVITETEQMTAAAGRSIFELSIDGLTHGTANFIVNVEKKPIDGAIMSDSDLSLISQAVDSAAVIVDVIGDSDPSEVIGEHVDAWLDNHPEATTTVEDGAITAPKINNSLWDKLLVSESASGAVASFDDGADDVPVSSLKVALEPIQLGSGDPSPSNIRPIVASNGKNLIPSATAVENTVDGITYKTTGNGIYYIDGTATKQTSCDFFISGTSSLLAGYKLSFFNTFTGVNLFFRLGGTDKAYWGFSLIKRTVTIAAADAVEFDQFRLIVPNGTTVHGSFALMMYDSDIRPNYTPYQGITVTAAGKNLLNQAEFVQGSITNTGADSTSGIRLRSPFIKVKPNTKYAFQCNSEVQIFEIHAYDANYNWVRPYVTANATSYIYTTGADTQYIKVLIRYADNSTILPSALTAGMVEEGDTVSEYEPFTGNSYPYTLGRDVYGGTVDLATGVLTVTHGIVDLGSLTWTKPGVRFSTGFQPTAPNAPYAPDNNNAYVANAICSQYRLTSRAAVEAVTGYFSIHKANAVYITVHDDRYTDVDGFVAGVTGQTVCYELMTPQTYQLTPQEVKTLLGYNNISSTGTVDVIYHADTKLYVDKMTAVDNNIIAPTEEGFTATRNYTVNDLVIVNDTLYKVTSNIQNGGTITPNSNVTQTTLSALIKALS